MGRSSLTKRFEGRDNHNPWDKDRSVKLCICGGHNHSNASRNLKHNSTKMRYLYRLSRQHTKAERECYYRFIYSYFDKVDGT